MAAGSGCCFDDLGIDCRGVCFVGQIFKLLRESLARGELLTHDDGVGEFLLLEPEPQFDPVIGMTVNEQGF